MSGRSLAGAGDDEHPAEEVVALIKKNGGEAAVNSDDISSWDGAKHVVEQAIETFGSLDILVNNAGIVRDKMSFNTDESDWDDVIRVHLKGHFATAAAAAYWRNRAKAGEEVSGRIINTSSEAGLYGNPARPLRRRQGGHRRLDVDPRPRARALRRDGQRHRPPGPHPHDRRHFRRGRRPAGGDLRRLGPEERGHLVGFLAAPEAADINGQIFVVFGANIWAMSAFRPGGPGTRDATWTPQRVAGGQRRALPRHRLGIGPVRAHLSTSLAAPAGGCLSIPGEASARHSSDSRPAHPFRRHGPGVRSSPGPNRVPSARPTRVPTLAARDLHRMSAVRRARCARAPPTTAAPAAGGATPAATNRARPASAASEWRRTTTPWETATPSVSPPN